MATPAAQVAKLTEQLRSFPPAQWRDEAIAALSIIEGKAETRHVYHDTFGGFRGTRDEYKEFLYWGVLHVWLTLGGRLTYTVATNGGKVSGKAFDFFTACVKPLLGNETPIAGFRRSHRPHAEHERSTAVVTVQSARGSVRAPSPNKILFRSDGDGNAYARTPRNYRSAEIIPSRTVARRGNCGAGNHRE